MPAIEIAPAFDWPNCCRLTNDQVELIATTDVGPRILHFGFRGAQNLLHVEPGLQGRTGGDDWLAFGGHRLWHAPEAYPRSYAPDNAPVTVERLADGVRLTQPVEPATGIQKELEIALDPAAPRVRVRHWLRNLNPWPIELAPWALTVMAAGGTAVLPLPPRAAYSHDQLLPNGQLTLWPYTNLADPRWTLGHQFVLLRQDPAHPSPQKIGLVQAQGWAGYVLGGDLFVKSFGYDPAARYPDLNSSFESYVDGSILELETLAPLTSLAPGASVVHEEAWRLWRGVPTPTSDGDVEATIVPRVASAG